MLTNFMFSNTMFSGAVEAS